MNQKGFNFSSLNRAASLVLAMVFALGSQAQTAAPAASKSSENAIEIIGTIIDRGTKQPLEFATISLFSKKDSTLLTGTTSIADGSFSLKTNNAEFYLLIEFLAYVPVYFSVAKPNIYQKKYEVGIVALMPDITKMAVVEV
ncbi:MAG: hypothetical protein IT258_15125, partial [Saprospiraceae bacterium]|nr:hypothetical protein [Saprospiraceae bacterium]